MKEEIKCDINDTVWITAGYQHPKPYKVCCITVNEHGVDYVCRHDGYGVVRGFTNADIGKTVFLGNPVPDERKRK